MRKKAIAFAIATILMLNIILLPISATSYSKTVFYFFIQCMNFVNRNDCVSAGCYWWDNSCHSYPVAVEKEITQCFKLEEDEDIILCITSTGTQYIIIST